MYYKNCKNFVGDEDCGKCLVNGYIYSCQYSCRFFEEHLVKRETDAEDGK